MSLFAHVVLIVLGLSPIGALVVRGFHEYQLSRAIENYGRHSHAAVHK